MEAMMDRIISGGECVFYRHQQINEADLNEEEKKEILEKLFISNKTIFVERYARWMSSEDVDLFPLPDQDNPLLYSLLKRVIKQKGSRTRIRNRRFLAMQNLREQGSYFSEEKMREREPYLYDQMIGRYLSEEDRLELRPTTSESVSEGGWGRLLEEFDDSGETARRRQWKNEEWNGDCKEDNERRARFHAHVHRVVEMDDEELEKEDVTENSNGILHEMKDELEEIINEIDAEDESESEETVSKEVLRSEFISLMEEKFLAGLDSRFFDYESIDNAEELDGNDKIAEREEEEKWFEEDE